MQLVCYQDHCVPIEQLDATVEEQSVLRVILW